jgi:hypothetical protein
MKSKTLKILFPMALILFAVVAMSYGFENMDKNSAASSDISASEVTATWTETTAANVPVDESKAGTETAAETDDDAPETSPIETLGGTN